MPRFEYRCPSGHVHERIFAMTDEIPDERVCNQPIRRFAGRLPFDPSEVELRSELPVEEDVCAEPARRVWSPLAAIHFNAPGFYSTDVKARQERRRRTNPGDDLYVGHDRAAADIARSL